MKTNVPAIICKRLCIYQKFGKCIKPREWRDIPDDCTWGGHYCVDRNPTNCIEFIFDSNKTPLRCRDCKWFCEVKHYEDWVLVGIGIGCRKMEEWGVPSPINCKNYKRIWYLFWRPK